MLEARSPVLTPNTMEIPIEINVPDPSIDSTVLDEVDATRRLVNATLSTLRPDSELSRLNRDEITLAEAHPDVRAVLQRCEQLRRETDGYFDVRVPLLPPGVEATPRALASAPLDPTAYVKGWAVDLATQKLDAAGACNYCVSAGGNLRVRGGSASDSVWRIALRHPLRRDRIMGHIATDDLALATSDVQAWGTSVVDPHTGLSPSGVLSVAVVGPNLAPACAYAIAIHAMGESGPDWISRRLRSGYEALIILENDTIVSTPGFPAT